MQLSSWPTPLTEKIYPASTAEPTHSRLLIAICSMFVLERNRQAQLSLSTKPNPILPIKPGSQPKPSQIHPFYAFQTQPFSYAATAKTAQPTFDLDPEILALVSQLTTFLSTYNSLSSSIEKRLALLSFPWQVSPSNVQ